MNSNPRKFSFFTIFILLFVYVFIESTSLLNPRQTLASPNDANVDSNSPWKYQVSTDKMGRGDIKTASVFSLNTVNFAFPYAGEQLAILQLRIHPKFGNDIQLIIPRGQFLCGIYNCQVSIRFDDGKPHNYIAVAPADHSTNLLFIRGYNKFLAAARKSKKVYIEALFFQQGSRVFEFDISGLKWPPNSKK